jgi:hypothetical protein
LIIDRRLKADDLQHLDLSDHHRRLMQAAWRLGGQPGLAKLHLRRWAHTFGYRGHWLTKSRQWSTTFAALRQARHQWRLKRDDNATNAAQLDENTVVIGEWTYAGSGYHSEGDTWLAISAAKQHQLNRRIAWEERGRANLRPQPLRLPSLSHSTASGPGPVRDKFVLATHEGGQLDRQIARKSVKGPKGRETLLQFGMEYLKHPLRLRQISESVLAQIRQAHTLGKPPANQSGGHRRAEQLAAMSCGHQPGAPVDCRTEVVAVALFGVTGMEGHPNPDGRIS